MAAANNAKNPIKRITAASIIHFVLLEPTGCGGGADAFGGGGDAAATGSIISILFSRGGADFEMLSPMSDSI